MGLFSKMAKNSIQAKYVRGVPSRLNQKHCCNKEYKRA